MLSWVMELRIAGGQDMTNGRSLGRYLKHFDRARADGSAPAFTEWAALAQDRAGWWKLVTKRPFDVGKPHVRPPRCDTRVSPEDIWRFMAQRAAEVAQRRAIFDAAVATPTP
jgi:protocatechuate 3,4-dioxygenase beta subunit